LQLGVNFRWHLGPMALAMYSAELIRKRGFMPWHYLVQIPKKKQWRIAPRLAGAHQVCNAALVVAVAEQLNAVGFAISEDAMWHGLAEVEWPARFELFDTQPRAVLDCAHNVASMEALVSTLEASFLPILYDKTFFIFAASNDKDVSGMFRVLVPHFHSLHFRRIYLTRYGDNPRSVPPEQMAAWLPSTAAKKLCPTPADAWRAACSDATPETLVVIAGSVFLAGELRPILIKASGRS
jgi:dihydrofolate synthase/folylpolyglutamate synthase